MLIVMLLYMCAGSEMHESALREGTLVALHCCPDGFVHCTYFCRNLSSFYSGPLHIAKLLKFISVLKKITAIDQIVFLLC